MHAGEGALGGGGFEYFWKDEAAPLKAGRGIKFGRDGVFLVQKEVGHHRPDCRAHGKADFEAAVGDKLIRVERVRPNNRRARMGSGAQTGPAFEDRGPVKRGQADLGACDERIEGIIGSKIVEVAFRG